MKKSVIILIVLIAMSAFCSGAVSVKNYSMPGIFNSNQNISGSINLTITDTLSNTLFRINTGQSMTIKDFLDKNNANYTCASKNCRQGYNSLSDSEELSIKISGRNESVFGFPIRGQKIEITDLQFDILSDFGEQDEVPLTLKFFNKSYSWTFNEYSTNFGRSFDYGCYESPSIVDYPYKLSPNTMYCEYIAIPETKKVELGAQIGGSQSSSQFQMKLFNSNKNQEKTCQFSAPQNNSCIITSDTFFSAGSYYVCIKAAAITDYGISAENKNGSCGWVGSSSSLPTHLNSTWDYGIFAKTPNYASAKKVRISGSALTAAAKSYLQSEYNKNCSSTCILPVFVSGVDQNLSVKSVSLTYLDEGGVLESSKVSPLSIFYPSLNFNGVLNLDKSNFNVGPKGNKTLSLYLGSDLLFSKQVNVLSTASINYLSPINPPAGLEVNFSLSFDSDRQISKIIWNWGDSSTPTETSVPYAKHKYSALGIYSATITIYDSANSSMSRTFEVSAGTPKDLINISLSKKKNSLQNAMLALVSFPSWYQSRLRSSSNITDFDDGLRQIENKKASALTDEDYLALFNQIQSFNPPYSFSFSEIKNSPLMTDLESVNPEAVKFYTGGSSEEDLSLYKSPIVQWQIENVQASIKSQKISLSYLDSTKKALATTFSGAITSLSDEESYIIIDYPFDSIIFKEDSSGRKNGESTLIILEPGETKNFEFFINEDVEPAIFVSPKLSSLQTASQIGACNFNKICEKDNEENYKNCRSDCYPVGPFIFYLILLILFAFVAYSLMVYWYKTRYEDFLFKERKYLYNLVMFIKNARTSGLKDSAISSNLSKQGWNSEQINYAFKKADGKNTGMFEIIPFTKVFDYFRNKKMNQNINKAPIQGITKW